MDLAPVLDGPGRDAWQRPDEVIAALAIRPGQRSADVGCGTGYFTLRILRASAPGGRVIAVDIQQGMLDLLGKRLGAADRGLVTLRRSPPDRPLLPGDALELVLCANTLNEVEDADQARFVESMAGALAPGGRMAIINWLPSRTRLGPPVEQRISPARVRELAEGAGLSLAEDLDILPMHSFLVFTKPR
jgi:ubiquinone/menaquinone biosynthesis C-methylase UbiE